MEYHIQYIYSSDAKHLSSRFGATINNTVNIHAPAFVEHVFSLLFGICLVPFRGWEDSVEWECTTFFSVCGAGDWTQGLVSTEARDLLLSFILSPVFYKSVHCVVLANFPLPFNWSKYCYYELFLDIRFFLMPVLLLVEFLGHMDSWKIRFVHSRCYTHQQYGKDRRFSTSLLTCVS